MTSDLRETRLALPMYRPAKWLVRTLVCQPDRHALNYKGQSLAAPLKLDLLIERVVIVEIKALQRLETVHAAQLLTYLRLTGLTSGLLLNFNEITLKQGIQRVSNSLRPSAYSAPLR